VSKPKASKLPIADRDELLIQKSEVGNSVPKHGAERTLWASLSVHAVLDRWRRAAATIVVAWQDDLQQQLSTAERDCDIITRYVQACKCISIKNRPMRFRAWGI
jgi:hypothetical protein